MEVRQYQIVVVNLDPTIGSKIKKIRPCVILSPDEMNLNLRTIVIAPITSTKKNYPTRVKVIFENKEGRIVVDQIRTVDKLRIVKIVGELTTKESIELKSVIRRTFVD
jgi:mRNA interferase MazF